MLKTTGEAILTILSSLGFVTQSGNADGHEKQAVIPKAMVITQMRLFLDGQEFSMVLTRIFAECSFKEKKL